MESILSNLYQLVHHLTYMLDIQPGTMESAVGDL